MRPTEHTPEVHHPIPLNPTPAPLPVVPASGVPEVTTIVLPDGRTVTGYTVPAAQPAPLAAKPPVSRAAVNIALGGVGFAAVCGGLFLLTAFIAALTAFITQLVILAAVIFGGWNRRAGLRAPPAARTGRR
ncbi:integral membrane protein [Streptomyces sp. SPB78]|nr:integral membrane protein [Streptomyces sp. SPB78]